MMLDIQILNNILSMNDKKKLIITSAHGKKERERTWKK